MKIKLVVFVLVAFGFLHACKSVKGKEDLLKCEFKNKRVTKVAFGGIDILGRKSINDFQIHEGLFLASEIKNKRLTTDLAMDLSVRNPNSLPVVLKSIQYVLVFDGKEILNEESEYEIEIQGKGISSVPVSFRFDLLQLINDTGYDKIINMAFGLVDGNKQLSTFDLYIRPDIRVNNKKMKYSDFIKLSNIYQSGRKK